MLAVLPGLVGFSMLQRVSTRLREEEEAAAAAKTSTDRAATSDEQEQRGDLYVNEMKSRTKDMREANLFLSRGTDSSAYVVTLGVSSYQPSLAPN